MGIAGLVLGVVAAVFTRIPFLGGFAAWVAIVGVILCSIVMGKEKAENKLVGTTLAGLILSVTVLIDLGSGGLGLLGSLTNAANSAINSLGGWY